MKEENEQKMTKTQIFNVIILIVAAQWTVSAVQPLTGSMKRLLASEKRKRSLAKHKRIF